MDQNVKPVTPKRVLGVVLLGIAGYFGLGALYAMATGDFGIGLILLVPIWLCGVYGWRWANLTLDMSGLRTRISRHRPGSRDWYLTAYKVCFACSLFSILVWLFVFPPGSIIFLISAWLAWRGMKNRQVTTG
jgi:hypothetical protein